MTDSKSGDLPVYSEFSVKIGHRINPLGNDRLGERLQQRHTLSLVLGGFDESKYRVGSWWRVVVRGCVALCSIWTVKGCHSRHNWKIQRLTIKYHLTKVLCQAR